MIVKSSMLTPSFQLSFDSERDMLMVEMPAKFPVPNSIGAATRMEIVLFASFSRYASFRYVGSSCL